MRTISGISFLLFRRITQLFCGFSIVISFSCGRNNTDPVHSAITQNSVSSFKATKFSLVETDSCSILTVFNPWQGAQQVEQRYYLVRRNSEKINIPDTSLIINIPLRNVICTSTTHIAMISALGEQRRIAGVSGARYIYDEILHQKAESGEIKDIGSENGMNTEMIMHLRPELVIVYGVGSESLANINKLRDMGIKILFNADYLENDPLGKAEWIRVFGALFDKQYMADSLFNSIAASYFGLKEMVERGSDKRPSVLLGLPFRDTWYISPGNSYISRLIHDAGGSYLWADTKSDISMPYGIENVYARSLTADYWLNIGNVMSAEEIRSFDSRLAALPCFSAGNLFNNNKRISKSGGNDYWESGILMPHVILRDIISILHPGLTRDYEPYFYRKIE